MLTFEECDMLGLDDDDGSGLLCEEAMPFSHAGGEGIIINEILNEVRDRRYVHNCLS